MYIPTIGLEIHAELNTESKMFCRCKNDPDEKQPNVNVCPICLGHPGTLPTANRKAIEAVLRLGLAMHCEIPSVSKFDRKNYFYPDLPKGYQISQYDEPLCSGGYLELSKGDKSVRLERIHLEEDAGRLLHGGPSETSGRPASLVDFNRAGLPLMELVTKPDLHDAKEAVMFAKELQLILRYMGVSNADMEKGNMRVEANISVSKDKEKLGTKVEVKNLNSFRVVENAILYEIKRQTELLEAGEKVVQETRGWDESGKTVSQRSKEEAHDYRYFPEPDVPPLTIGFNTRSGDAGDETVFDVNIIARDIPELPAKKRTRFEAEYNLPKEQINTLVDSHAFASFFEEAASELLTQITEEQKEKGIQLLANYLTSDVRGLMNERGIAFQELKLSPKNASELVVLLLKGELSSRIAKDLLKKMIETGADPHVIIKDEGMAQISDGDSIKQAVQEIIAENPQAVEDYKKGKQNAVQFLIGRTMGKLKGKGNPDVIGKLVQEELKG